MSQLKYCQGPKCHEYHTKDRIRGSKGDKHYETRKKTLFYYLNGNACSMICQNDWFNKFGNLALNHFGRIHEPKRTGCDSAWYKVVKFRHSDNSSSYYDHYFVNDLIGERKLITEEQYNDERLTHPNGSLHTE